MSGYMVALIALGGFSLGIHTIKHGEPREDKYNFFTALIALLLQFWLIYMAWPKGGGA